MIEIDNHKTEARYAMNQINMNGTPQVHSTAVVRDSQLGKWTAVGARTMMTETFFGDYSYVSNDSEIIYAEIGKFCSIASHASINPGNHPTSRAAQHHFSYRSRFYALSSADDEKFFNWRRKHKVILGHDVWIGHGAIILPGVTIGTGAVLGAGAVATRDIPPFTVAAGVPAGIIKRRFAEEVEEALMRIRWWDWSHEQLAAALNDFRSLDADDFAAKYDIYYQSSPEASVEPQSVLFSAHANMDPEEHRGHYRIR